MIAPNSNLGNLSGNKLNQLFNVSMSLEIFEPEMQ